VQRREPKNRKGVGKMKNLNRNIRVLAENRNQGDGFNIYLDLSGQKEFLMFHRHNGLLFSLLRDGICVDDLTRWTPRKGGLIWGRQAEKMVGMVSHLVDVIMEYLENREIDLEMGPGRILSTQQRRFAA